MIEATMRKLVENTGWKVRRVIRDTNRHGLMAWRVDIVDDAGESLEAFGDTRNEAYVNIIALAVTHQPRVLKQEYRA